MATKGDISELDILQFGGKPMIPLVAGFNRFRKSGVVRSDVAGGATRQRKKYFGMPHVASVTFYLRSPMMQDFIQSFINKNEGKKFICHLSADRPIVEPYVVQALSDWNHVEVNSVEGTVTCQFEIFSTKDECLDQFFYDTYSCMGEDTHCILDGLSEVVTSMPINVPPQRITQPLTHVLAPGNPVVKLVGDLTTNRATTGTYGDKNDGSLKTAAVNELREEAEGYLIEGSSTNNVVGSDDFINWVRYGSTVTGDLSVEPSSKDPSNTPNVFRITNTLGVNGPVGVYKPNSFIGNGINEETACIWARASANGVVLRVGYDSGAANKTLSTKWVRYSVSHIMTSLNFIATMQSTGDTGEWVELSFAQSEELPFATSYIPTTVAPVTRSADNVSFEFAGNMILDVYSVSVEVSVLDVAEVGIGTNTRKTINQVDGSANHRSFLDTDSSRYVSIAGSDGIDTINIVDSQQGVSLVTVRNGDFLEVASDGVFSGTPDLSVTNIPSTLTTINVGSHGLSSQYLYGHIRNLRIYDFALNQEEVELLAGV